jgi:class 3 adenylate cyclase/tetratricopeptide (TPR) repeat protein
VKIPLGRARPGCRLRRLSTMIACPSCGAENPPEARFCANCGHALSAICSKCGAQLNPDAQFCHVCGQPVAEVAPAEERKLVTVLFADVTGSTGLGERLDAERLKEVMGAYFAAMREEIEAEGGTVEKFIGDAVMAAFGVPAAHEDDTARALRAATRMRRRLEELNAKLSSSHGIALEIRIGVNTGEVVAVTEPRPGEGMVTGDAVNIAARLEQTAEPGQTLVAERTARASRGFLFADAGPLRLKGKGQAVPALLLVGERGGEERGVPGLHAPLVGREHELGLLHALYDRVSSESRPHLVTIYGDAGVGKSRLVAEFLGEAERRDPVPLLVRGRCLPYGEGVTYSPLAEILKSLAGVLDTDPSDLTIEKIRKLGRELMAEGLATDPTRATAALAYTVGVEDPDAPMRDLPPRQVRLETHAAWRSFFSALARDRPVIAVVEDIHWADPAMLDLLEELADRLQGPVQLLCPARLELTERRATWGGGKRSFSSIYIDPLSRDEADRLVGFLLTVEDLPPSIHDRILARAEGNPFFLEEIVRHLIDEGGILREGGRWRAGTAIAEVVIPDTVQAVLAARIDLLAPEEKRALRFAAVVGRVFWTGPVARLLDQPRDEIEEVLDRLEVRELVESRLSSSMGGDREYIFKHILTRDVAYESLPRRERWPAHGRVATWIEETAGQRQREFVEQLAHHYSEAYRGAQDELAADHVVRENLRRNAFGFLLKASDDARSKLALTKAERLAEQALIIADGLMERAMALENLGEAYLYDYEGDLAWKTLSEAVEARLASVPVDGMAVARLSARALETPVRNAGLMHAVPPQEETAHLLKIGLSHIHKGDSEELVRLLTMKSFWPWTRSSNQGEPLSESQLLEARQAGEEAAGMALRLGRADLASAALDGVGSYYLERGHYGPGLPVIERRLELAPQVEDPWELQDIFNMAAWFAFHIGHYRDAVRYADEGFERWAVDVPAMAMHCLPWRALARFRLGDWDQFLDDVARTEELLGDRREHPQPFFARHFAAAALVRDVQGDFAGADRYLELLRRLENEMGRPPTLSVPWMAMLLARRGEFGEARSYLAKGEPHGSRGVVLEAHCDVLAEMAAWDEAADLLQESREHAEAAGLLALPLFADRLEGGVALAAGDPASAVPSLRRAADGFAGAGARWEAALTRLSLGEALARAGERIAAQREVDVAVEVFRELRSMRELRQAQDLLGRLG